MHQLPLYMMTDLSAASLFVDEHAVIFAFDVVWSLLNSLLTATSFLTKALSCIVAYTSDLAFALANFF